MKAARNLAKTYLADESGATVVEYGLICALLVLAIVGSLSAVGTNAAESYQAAADSFPETD